MTVLENKQIGGITVKIAAIIMFSTITTCASVFAAYWGIKSAIAVHEVKINDLDERVKNLERYRSGGAQPGITSCITDKRKSQ